MSRSIHRFPRVLLKPDRKRAPEKEPVALCVLEGGIPEDLAGDYFVVAPGGHPNGQTASVWLGTEGVVFRVRFSDGEATVFAGAARGPSGQAAAMANDLDFKPFQSVGIAALSLTWPWSPSSDKRQPLGARNLSNTAVVPISLNGAPALAVTYDGGRPLVMHPETLKVVGVLGNIRGEWRGALFRDDLFPFINSSAHPGWDGKDTLYSINFARSIRLMFAKSAGSTPEVIASDAKRALDDVRDDEDLVVSLQDRQPWAFYALLGDQDASATAFAGSDTEGSEIVDGGRHVAWTEPASGSPFVQPTYQLLGLRDYVEQELGNTQGKPGWGSVWTRIRGFASSRLAELRESFTDLVRFKEGRFERFELYELSEVGEERSIRIVDSVHTIAVTENYIVFADCRFKFDLDLILGDAFRDLSPEDQGVVRTFLSRRQADTTTVYVVLRDDLNGDEVTRVRAHRVGEFEAEVVHFFAEERGDGIDILAVHQRAFDASEFLGPSDKAAGGEYVDSELMGMFPSPLDVQEFAAYRITSTEDTLSMELVWEPVGRLPAPDRTPLWGIGIGTGPGILTGVHHTDQPSLNRTFWYDQGLFPELVTAHTYELYRSYKRRDSMSAGDARRPLQDLKNMIKNGGQPGHLLEVTFEACKQPRITGYHAFPAGVVMLSPQWLPIGQGYVAGPVFRDKPGENEREREFWIFAADDLSQPVARLDATPAGWGHTIHTCYLPAQQCQPIECDAIAFKRDLQGMDGDGRIVAVYATLQPQS